ncbi:uncharacterized protein LOC133500539 [Syngnathoides biaculeatus]|uniref:uncharacterized protein LOC133500539 n=1 Tax=Syngnathoides biaculeatus TaxID=300417 RepID=UPI002ADE9507|nr:uncharacterized protein LOC133500539 [Syngnathoides biaculeatus]XP_061675314.1 uncharacterized protein LOC133500539 [Syngnathoides biaculeatus]
MSVSMTKEGGVTMLTLSSNPKSRWPPLCQILGALCYSPACCSVSRHLRGAAGTSQSVLGALHIMVGLLNVGLGVILMCSGPASSWEMDSTAFPHWSGALFILFGVVCILSERFPSPCLVLVNAILNFLGIAFAIAAIVLYAKNAANIHLWPGCREYDYGYGSRRRATTTPSPHAEKYLERCLEGQALTLMLLRGINGVAIALSVLELALVVSSCALAIKLLNCDDGDHRQQGRPKADGECEPLLEEVVA